MAVWNGSAALGKAGLGVHELLQQQVGGRGRVVADLEQALHELASRLGSGRTAVSQVDAPNRHIISESGIKWMSGSTQR